MARHRAIKSLASKIQNNPMQINYQKIIREAQVFIPILMMQKVISKQSKSSEKNNENEGSEIPRTRRNFR